MAKMNYGPRFGGSAKSLFSYDERVDKAMQADTMRMAAVMKNQPQYKKELRGIATAKRTRQRTAAIRNNGRKESEIRMAEALRKVVGILEMHMDDLMQYTQVGNERIVNQTNIHNAIVMLRTKCGLNFVGSEQYSHRIKADPGQGVMTSEKKEDERIRRQEEQKQERKDHLKRIAEKFANYRKPN
jgi:molecular chaperone GrpE (heat shock protein)